MPADEKQTELRDKVIETLLPDVTFDGWSWAAVEKAAQDNGCSAAIFPHGLSDVIDHFSDMADRNMITALQTKNPDEMRIRDRVSCAVLARLKWLSPHKEAVRLALAYWSIPPRSIKAGKALWRTADKIWLWSGDTTTDYNHYTKRLLLSGVLSTTTLAWLNDQSDDMIETEKFLERRIENVMQLGRLTGKKKRA